VAHLLLRSHQEGRGGLPHPSSSPPRQFCVFFRAVWHLASFLHIPLQRYRCSLWLTCCCGPIKKEEEATTSSHPHLFFMFCTLPCTPQSARSLSSLSSLPRNPSALPRHPLLTCCCGPIKKEEEATASTLPSVYRVAKGPGAPAEVGEGAGGNGKKRLSGMGAGGFWVGHERPRAGFLHGRRPCLTNEQPEIRLGSKLCCGRLPCLTHKQHVTQEGARIC
jgi:hypothetical protein